MNTYRIHIGTNDFRNSATYDVLGVDVEINGFEEFEFFIHENPFKDDDSTRYFGRRYILCEKSTGLSIEAGHTHKEVIKRATDFLNEKGRESIRRQINKRLNQIKRLA